ncbi:response regulator transcription factor [Actinomadura sp. NPDC023710]|uniref:response regulator transcription factor n=1 Tax=Actinomadura sp. NPDC023710 TaxID=3158219 RepID=UPI0033DC05AB
MPEPIRVLLVDDEWLVRAGLATMLGGVEGIEIAGEAADGAAVPAAVRATRADVVLMDIRMPGTDGLTATRLLRAAEGAPEVIVLTTFDTDEHVLRALRAGAGGFLLKDTPPAEIVTAIRRVADGEPMLSPSVTRKLITHVTGRDHQTRTAARTRLACLTDSERRVAEAVGRGLSNAEAAAELYMSVTTVKSYVSRIMRKLDLNNRVQIALLVHDAE